MAGVVWTPRYYICRVDPPVFSTEATVTRQQRCTNTILLCGQSDTRGAMTCSAGEDPPDILVLQREGGREHHVRQSRPMQG